MNVLEVRQLNKHFGPVHAVKDVSFGIPEGAVFGLIGRNGAGKTTTIRMMMNIIAPDSGEILLHGQPITRDFSRRISYLPEERGLYRKMRVLDVLDFFMELKGIKPATVRQQALAYLERFQLAERRNARVEDLSKGNQQKVQFICAILSDPDFLILDEPFSGLDPVNTGLLVDIVDELKQRGKVIIFSTHLMDFAERLCDRIALIHQGELLLNGALADIKRQYARRSVTLTCDGPLDFLREHPLVASLRQTGKRSRVQLQPEADSQALLRLLVERQLRVTHFEADDISLQEVFLEVAGDAPASPTLATSGITTEALV